MFSQHSKMNTMISYEKERDLENYVGQDEGGEIQLLGDSSVGKWKYFFSWY